MTDTKNFKKQVEEAQEKIYSQNNKDGFYSFIERDYIHGYYDKNKRKKTIIKTVSLGSILFLLWNTFAIYTWIKPIIDNINPRKSSNIERIFDHDKYQLQEVGSYLDDVNEIRVKVNTYLDYSSKNLDEVLKHNPNSMTRRDYFDNIEKYRSEISQLSINLQIKRPPEKMIDIHQMALNDISLAYQMCTYAAELTYTVSSNTINNAFDRINHLNSERNINSYKQREQLIKIFNEIGMMYYEENGILHYSWNK